MAQAKVISEQELKRALAIIAGRRHADRDITTEIIPEDTLAVKLS